MSMSTRLTTREGSGVGRSMPRCSWVGHEADGSRPAAIVLALAVAGLGRAAPERHVSNLRIQLTASAVVPAPSDVSGDAHGRAVVRLSTADWIGTADWIDLRHFNLMSKVEIDRARDCTDGLTGQATRVHIHTGRRWESPRHSDIPGMALCRRAACRSPIHTSLEVSGTSLSRHADARRVRRRAHEAQPRGRAPRPDLRRAARRATVRTAVVGVTAGRARACRAPAGSSRAGD